MNDLIYNQNDIPLNQHRYGFRPSAQVGCGWVATHNALGLMGYRTDIDQLIRYYEWQLPLIHGNAGTSFWGPAVCFKNWGFPVEMVMDRKRFDEAAKGADVCILFYRWRKKVKFGAHFVTLHHTPRGFVGYNTSAIPPARIFMGKVWMDFCGKRSISAVCCFLFGKNSSARRGDVGIAPYGVFCKKKAPFGT